MPADKIKEFLNEHDVQYSIVHHEETYTAQETAKLTRIRGKKLAKTIIIRLDGIMSMAVLSATHRIDFDRLRRVTGSSEVELATEDEFEGIFPGCETGAMPPFGNLYGMDVLADKDLVEDENIAFCAGSHKEIIMLTQKDFLRLVNPIVMDFTTKTQL